MPLDTTKIGELYDVLEGKASNTLNSYIAAFALSEEQKASVISNTIATIINKSVDSVQQQQLIEYQISEADAKTDLIYKQIDEIEASIIREDNKATALIEKTTQDKLYVMEQIISEQKRNIAGGLIDKDISLKTSQILLVDRQYDGFDDSLLIEKTKSLEKAVFGYAMSEQVIPTDLNTAFFNGIKANNFQTLVSLLNS